MKRETTGWIAAATLLAAGPAMANSLVTGLGAKLAASPVNAVGACPQTITFNGYVAIDAGQWDPGQPALMAVQFQRSDGAMAPVTYFAVSAPGKHSVSDTWMLGGASLPSYSGWEQIMTWQVTPGTLPYTFSNKATFHVQCRVRREGLSPRP